MLKIDEVKVGMRIKISLPIKFLGIHLPNVKKIWLKGKIIEVFSKAIIVKCKSRKYYIKIPRLICISYNGYYTNIKSIIE